MKSLLYVSILFCFVIADCSNEEYKQHLSLLDDAERLLLTDADSASLLLDSLLNPEELSDRDFARWCMLCGKATNYTHADRLLVYQWKRAQEWINQHGSLEERAQVALFLGRAYAEDGEPELAMKTYTDALHFAKEREVYDIAGYICTYMADLYRFSEMSNEVRMKYKEAASLFSKSGNLKSQAYAMKNLAVEYAFVDSFLLAEKIMKEVDSIADILNVQRLDYNIANAYANIYDLKGCYDLSEKYYKKAISLDTRYSIRDSVGLADSYLASGKIALAKELVNRMYLHDSTDFVLNNMYSVIYKAEGNYKEALHFKEVCVEILDSMFIKQSKEKVFEVEKKYNHLKMREQNIRLKSVRQRMIIYFITCFSLLIIGVLIFFFYHKNVKMKMHWQEEKLNNLNNERSEIAVQLSDARHSLETMQGNRDENLRLQQKISFLTEKYKQLQKQRLEASPIYKKFLALSAKNQPSNNKPLLTNKLWNTFVIEFCKIYSDFRISLFNQSPDLSEDEWRYCCLHILGFDGNSEAILLGIMPSSVWIKRSRIKQKLGYSAQKELSLYDILVNNYLN